MNRTFLPGVLALCTFTIPASAAPQHWTFSFDPSIPADPTATQQKVAQGDASYPLLPVSRMTTLQSDAVTLFFWPETAAMLERAASSATAAPMTWPTTPSVCVAHASFTIPTLLTANPTPACTDADRVIRLDLADLGGCTDVEQPERYALKYNPSQARQSMGSIEDMIGLAGEAWTHAALPQTGLLPSDFVPTLRAVVGKIRHDALAQRLAQSKAAYAKAIGETNANAACFDPAAKTALLSGLASLTGEIDAASAYLEQLKTTGEAARSQEDACLAAKSRVRPALTLPSLTRREREFVAFWLGGTYWRMRGGGLIPLGKTQDARWYFLEQAFTQIGKMVGGQDGADAAFQLYTPIFEGWAEWQDMGHAGPGDKYDELVSMTARGERQVHQATNLLAQRSYTTLDLTAGGLSMGPCYFRGYWPLENFRYAAQLLPAPPYSDGIGWATAVGEFCFGASMGLGFAHTMLDGADTKKPPTATLCAGRVCGDDGCGGTCGACDGGKTCSAEGQCVVSPSCVPTCGGKACGDNGCGGSCGACGGGTTCASGQCVAGGSQCTGAECGVDGGATTAVPDRGAGAAGADAPSAADAGGCSCTTTRAGNGALGSGISLVGAALLWARRRRGRAR